VQESVSLKNSSGSNNTETGTFNSLTLCQSLSKGLWNPELIKDLKKGDVFGTRQCIYGYLKGMLLKSGFGPKAKNIANSIMILNNGSRSSEGYEETAPFIAQLYLICNEMRIGMTSANATTKKAVSVVDVGSSVGSSSVGQTNSSKTKASSTVDRSTVDRPTATKRSRPSTGSTSVSGSASTTNKPSTSTLTSSNVSPTLSSTPTVHFR
jgi:hypothetical protein